MVYRSHKMKYNVEKDKLRYEKMKKKSLIKYLGNILVLLSFCFIVRKFLELDVDFSTILSLRSLVLLFIISISYGIISVAQSYTWKRLVVYLTNINLPWYEVIKVYTKSNLMKYLPGNVMHFVGRNELAIRFQLSHLDVATATLIDTVISLIASVMLAIIFYFKGILDILQQYQLRYSYFIIAGIIGMAMLLVTILCRKKNLQYIHILQLICSKKGAFLVITSLSYYLFLGTLTSLLYIWILVAIVGQSFTFPVLPVLGAVSLSSMVGFITPGAPGGIGVREAVMSILLAEYLDVQSALQAIVLFRLISVIGDLFSFGGVKLHDYMNDR